MLIKSLYLKNFRIYEEALFEFQPLFNPICGPNATGKTTILEAIHFLALGRSFRTGQVTDLIRQGASYFYLEALFEKNGVEQRLKVSSDGKERRITFNSTPCQSLASLIGTLPLVTLTPDDATLVKGAPSLRRQFLDLQIAQSDPFYVHALMRYNRAMRQRNHLLRERQLATIESWEYELAHSAAYLCKQRAAAVTDLQQRGSALYRTLSGEDRDLLLTYKNNSPIASGEEQAKHYYLNHYQKLRGREMELGYTLSGPHKDDLIIEIGKGEARYFASEGQQRSIVAALHFAEWDRLHALSGEAPLLLIDDVGISLDSSRKQKLLSHAASLSQVFLTSTEKISLFPDGHPTERGDSEARFSVMGAASDHSTAK